jgi:hypothetical protein
MPADLPGLNVARRLGHSVEMRWKVYAGCLDGDEERLRPLSMASGCTMRIPVDLRSRTSTRVLTDSSGRPWQGRTTAASKIKLLTCTDTQRTGRTHVSLSPACLSSNTTNCPE